VSLAPFPKRRGCYVTPKQIEILRALVKRNPDGSLLDIYQLIERVAPNTVRGSMICSLKHLKGHGLITEAGKVKRRNRMMTVYLATSAGVLLVRPNSLPGATP
jgi:hypothetical protein